MDITPAIPKGRQLITGYGAGGFKVNHQQVEGSILICAQQTLPWDGAITLESLAPLLTADMALDLLLIGTGAKVAMPDISLREALKVRKIGLEVMDTGAACRTYNVLMTEERRIGAALIAV